MIVLPLLAIALYAMLVSPVQADVTIIKLEGYRKIDPIWGVLFCIKASGTTTEADGTEVYLVGPKFAPDEYDTETTVKDGKFEFEICGTSLFSQGKFKVKIGNNESEWTTLVVIEPPIIGGTSVPVNDTAVPEKSNLLTPYIGLASTVLVATVATSIYAKHVKRKKEKQ